MKKILSYAFIFVLFLMSCRKEELVRIPEFAKGINFVATADPEFSEFNAYDLANAKLVITTKSANADEVEKVDLSTVLVSGGVSSAPVVVKSLTGADLNGTVTITAQEFATAFGKNLDDLNGGDQFNVRYVATMKNGMVFSDENSSQGVITSGGTTFSTSLNVPVFCPTELAGTYTTLTTGTSTDSAPSPNPTVNFPSEITLEATGKTSYEISDAFGGLYLEWYDVYGITDPMPTTIIDVCGQLSVPTFTDPFGGAVTGSGTYDENGVITINWENEYGDEATTVYTKK